MSHVICNYKAQSCTINEHPHATYMPVLEPKIDVELLKCLGCLEECR